MFFKKVEFQYLINLTDLKYYHSNMINININETVYIPFSYCPQNLYYIYTHNTSQVEAGRLPSAQYLGGVCRCHNGQQCSVLQSFRFYFISDDRFLH